MRYDPIALRDVSARVDLVQVMGERIKLKKAGRIFKALCPFHQERTPSLQIYPETNTYYCFGCQANGNALTWFTKGPDGMDFRDAVHEVERITGVKIPEIDTPAAKAWDRQMGAIEAYRQSLWLPPEVITWCHSRGWHEDILRDLGCGFMDPEQTSKTMRLWWKTTADRQPNDLIDAGVAMDHDGRTVFRMERRFVLPIYHHGRPVGFSGRVIPGITGQDTPSWMNGPTTPYYQKHSMLLGGSWAVRLLKIQERGGEKETDPYRERPRIPHRDHRRVFLVEGGSDVLSMYHQGYASLACCGTSWHSSGLINFLHDLKSQQKSITFVLIPDQDEGGLIGLLSMGQASLLAVAEFMGVPYLPSVVMLPDGKDPGDVIEAKEDIEVYINGAVPFLDAVEKMRPLCTAKTHQQVTQSLASLARSAKDVGLDIWDTCAKAWGCTPLYLMHQAQEPVRKVEAASDPVRDILTLPAFTTPSWIAFRLHLLYPWVPKVWEEQDPLLKRLSAATPPQEQDPQEDWNLRLKLAHMDTVFHGLSEDEVRATLAELGFPQEQPCKEHL